MRVIIKFLENLTLVSMIIVAAGCATTTINSPSSPAAPERFAMNHLAFSQFYCENGRWPKYVTEVSEFATKNNIQNTLGSYDTISFSVPREVELSIEFHVKGTPPESTSAISFIAGPCSTTGLNGSAAANDKLVLAAGQLSLQLPSGFVSLNTAQIEQRYGAGRGPYPDYVFLQAPTNALISIRFGESPANPAEFKSLKSVLEQGYKDSTPGLVWKKRELLNRHGHSWIRLTFESDSSLGKLLNDSYFTDFKGQLLSFYFIAPVKDLNKIQPAFTNSFESIQLQPHSAVKRAARSLTPSGEIQTISRKNLSQSKVGDLRLFFSDEWIVTIDKTTDDGEQELEVALIEGGKNLKLSISTKPIEIRSEAFFNKFESAIDTQYKGKKNTPSKPRKIAGKVADCRHYLLDADIAKFVTEVCVISDQSGSVLMFMGGPENIYEKHHDKLDQLVRDLTPAN